MIWDNYPTLVMEYGSAPGIYGDSAAETGRYFSLVKYLASHGVMVTNVPDITKSFANFRTDIGYIRHPLVPPTWRETDFSEDQWIPLFIASNESNVLINNQSYSNEMYSRLKTAGYRTGNGDLIHPGTIGTLMRSKGYANWITDLPMLLGLIIIRYVPIRWSDTKKWFEIVTDNSGDYLNLIHQVMYADVTNTSTITIKAIKWLFKFCNLSSKISNYYLNESPWIVDLYNTAFSKLVK